MKSSFFRTGIFALVLVVCSVCTPESHAYEVPPNDGLVTVDVETGVSVLSEEQRRSISDNLVQYDRETSNQIAIVVVQSLQGEAIEDVALQIARTWGIGSAKDNGILILFAYEDSQVRIEVGYGLEGAIPDIVASGIIRDDMIPQFKEGQYATGLLAGVEALKKHIGGEYTADRYDVADSESSGFLIFFGFIVFQWMLAILGRSSSWWLGGVFGGGAGVVLAFLYSWWLSIPILILAGLFLDFIVSKSFKRRGPTKWWAGGGWGPGGGFGGGGGGFGGFGGGGFGGGGASGRW
jgi:uncharacterized protein